MKKGFTLIELLAVILILGIIALIAIPTVNNILKEARRGAFSSTLTNIEKAIEEKCTMEQIKNQEITTMYTITNGVISPSLDIKGDLPDGTIEVNTNCEVAFILSDKNFTGTKDFVSDIVITDESTNNTPTVIYEEAILNGAVPELYEGLIPVTIANDGTVKKANEYTKWYSYAEKKWANAVILKESGKVELNGTIKEESIKAYFVWIPRYKYKLFDMGNYNTAYGSKPSVSNAKTIEIIFENKTTPVSTGANVGEYHSHPAFQTFDTNGLWVSKFEASGTTSAVEIKPNQTSLRNIDLYTMFISSLQYMQDNNSHMMKNTEWGAITYLSLSEYGINKEININNNSNYITGYSSVINIDDASFTGAYGTDSTVTKPYNTEVGYKASSTGNITGVYDMTGGAKEYMSSYKDKAYTGSGFRYHPAIDYDPKYFDLYNVDSIEVDFLNRILGDATGELGPFYFYQAADGYNKVHSSWWGDLANFVGSGYYWFCRGGDYSIGTLAGQLYFDRVIGQAVDNASFRVVLAK